MVWWIDVAIVLVALAVLAAICVSLYGSIRRLLREIAHVRDQAPAGRRSTLSSGS
jgi:hypothetical protein